MSITPEVTINSIMAYWQELANNNEPYTRWASRRINLDGWEACKFFIEIMLNRRFQNGRVSAAANDFIARARRRAWSPKTMWQHIAAMKIDELRDFCTFRPENEWSGSYVEKNKLKFLGHHHHRGWLRENADLIIREYDCCVDRIWNNDLPRNNTQKIRELYRRFLEFSGFNQNRANLAVFSLVRDYAYAGGRNSRYLLKINCDSHVQKVINRAIIAGNPELDSAKIYVPNVLNNGNILDSPADFYQAVFTISWNFCKDDKCMECPIQGQCNTYLMSKINNYKEEELQIENNNKSNSTIFTDYKIDSFDLAYIKDNISLVTFSGSGNDIKQHDFGCSIEKKDELECNLRLTNNNRFVFSMFRCKNLGDLPRDIEVEAFNAPEEVLFLHQGADDRYYLIIRLFLDQQE